MKPEGSPFGRTSPGYTVRRRHRHSGSFSVHAMIYGDFRLRQHRMTAARHRQAWAKGIPDLARGDVRPDRGAILCAALLADERAIRFINLVTPARAPAN